MAKIFADRVKEITTTTGTGTYNLDGTESGFQTFVDAIGDSNTVEYCVTDGVDWEVGIGTVTAISPPTLSRDTIYASSNSGSAVNWGTGNKTVFGVTSADQITSIVSHLSETTNPHNVTKTQVGLGNVQDIDTTVAGNVNITDSGGHYTSTDVEGALQEVPSLIDAAGLDYFNELRDNTAPNDTVPVHYFEATGVESDIDLAIVPKGVGAIIANVADGTATGGNKRGTNAVDLQTARSSNSHVASGIGASIPGGEDNTASGNNSFTAGYNNQATNTTSIAIGDGCVSTGVFSVAIGNWGHATANTAMCLSTGDSYAGAQYSIAMGAGSTTRDTIGKVAYSTTIFGTTYGSAQSGHHILVTQTTDATTTVAITDWTSSNTTPTTSNVVGLPDNHAYTVIGYATARDTSTGDMASFEIKGSVKRGSGAATTALVGTPTITTLFNDTGAAAWTLALTANTTRGSVEVEVTGESSKTIHWVCELRTVEAG